MSQSDDDVNRSKYKSSSPRLMDRVRDVLRYHHYGLRTEEAYVRWIKQFIHFNGTRHPEEMGKSEIEAFLTNLAVNRNVAASTQNQALNAIVFLYKQVLDLKVAEDLAPIRSKKPVRLPVVLSQEEVVLVLSGMAGTYGLIAKLMYGGGLRVTEALRLRVQDVDFSNGYLLVRDGKGGKERTTLLAPSVIADLKAHLEGVKTLFEQDVAAGTANVYLPHALAKKYPNAVKTWGWQLVFPSRSLSADPRSGEIRRHHMHESGLQKSLRASKNKVGIDKRVTSHTLRHSFATHLLEAGTNIRVVQKLLGHADVKTTEIYTHVLQQNLGAVVSPLERIYSALN